MKHFLSRVNDVNLDMKSKIKKIKPAKYLITKDGKVGTFVGDVFIFDGKIIDISNDPVLNAKHEKAFKNLEKRGLPDDFLRSKK